MTYSTNHVRLLKNLWKEEINFLIIRIQIVSVKTIFAFYGCDSQGQPINVIIVGIIFGALGKHTPIPLIGTKNLDYDFPLIL